MKILLALSDRAGMEQIAQSLKRHHYMVDTVDNGEDALAYALSQHYDGIILGGSLTDVRGVSTIRHLRETGVFAPVMLVAGHSGVEERIEGLDAGADDYLTWPFAMGEMLARVRAMLRRREQYMPETLEFGHARLDTGTGMLSCLEEMEHLSRLELELMEIFMRNPRIAFSAEKLLEYIWGRDCEAQTDTVWVHVSSLRKKLKNIHADVEIRLRRGVGYALHLREE